MSNNPNGTDGPKVKIKASCFDCRHCKSTGYAVQGDSGHAVSCSLVDKRIGDTTWDTPTWCPLLAAAVDAANGTCDARAEIARLTAELAAARAVPADVEAAIIAYRDAAQSFGMSALIDGGAALRTAIADERIPALLATPAAVRWISAEPLLGAVDLGLPRTWLVGATARKILRDTGARGAVPAHLRPPPSLDWLVMGAESGPGSRAADPAWFRGLAEQCRSAGVSVFFKQGMPGDGVTAGPGSIAKRGGLIGLPYLDGRQHVEMPEVTRG